VLDRAPVADLLAGDDIVPMQADWTRPDPVIQAYLESFGRFGIPFNAVYGPGAPNGLPLPELLTAQNVQEAIAAAR
jgi:suppressor for copper-sensitivity B